jgi:CYTH domain-containing protein
MKPNNVEIEKKFLVRGDFYSYAIRKEWIVQAYLMISSQKNIRVRIKNMSAFLTIKGTNTFNRFSRYEYEYPLPLKEAEELFSLCLPGKIEKKRFYVPYNSHIFEVDVFYGKNKGLIVAELELSCENEIFEYPYWLGEEVTGNPKYYNVNLIK